ncbi:hypothetical protein AB0C22_26630 [Micromonospora sp. NPDC048894]|uniref:hypothetical protein n=1 Tax=Micromonospora sp. NPDC048894 TaxID=3155493 RepID=UPI0033D63F0D
MALSIYMASQLFEATADLVRLNPHPAPSPAELFDRFLAWTARPSTRAANTSRPGDGRRAGAANTSRSGDGRRPGAATPEPEPATDRPADRLPETI